MQIRNGIVEAIGHTPLIKLQRASELTSCTILGKAEFMNPGGSVKDRAGRQMILEAEARGDLRPGGLVVDAGAGRASELGLGSAVVLFAGAIASLAVWLVGPEQFEKLDVLLPYLVVDRFTMFFSFVLCLGGGLACLLAGGYLPEHKLERGEFFPLVMFSTVGAMALAAAGDLLSLFIALETMSLGVYCLIGLRRTSARASEAALKYFLLGSFAAALMLFGGALLYGATGHTDLKGIGEAIGTIGNSPNSVSPTLVLVALALSIAGLAFKVSAVPFHMWTPDAYEGAPTPATSYMAVAVKSAAFAVLLRVLIVAFGDDRLMSWGAGWPPVLALMAIVTMTSANVIAGRQDSVKRMLAYSSIAHAGYALVGVNIVCSGAFQGLGRGLPFLLLTATRLLAITLPLAWFLSLHLGAYGLHYAPVIANFATAVVAVAWVTHAVRRLPRKAGGDALPTA